MKAVCLLMHSGGYMIWMDLSKNHDQWKVEKEKKMKRVKVIIVFCITILFSFSLHAGDDLLPSWNDGKVKDAIVSFVKKVTLEKIQPHNHYLKRPAIILHHEIPNCVCT